ncbi:MAG: OadG family protein [Oscillospiraceae bacterium]|nr:OadG family protein [Oscillospiraceae bacterium]
MPLLTIPGEEAGLQVMDSLITAVLGYAVVFFGLVLLMVVVTMIGKIFAAKAAKAADKAPAEEPVTEVKEETDAPTAPGSAGDVKLHNVEPKIAAMLMAIVADKMQKPINELRFISIKEVE